MSNEADKCWLIQSGSEPAGPYSLAQLRSLARNGRIARSTLIRDLQSSGWLVAGQLPELFQQAVPTIKAADKPKPTRQPTTPARPASSPSPAAPDTVSMLPPPTRFGQQTTPANNRPAIIVAAIAGAVGSAVVVLLLVVSVPRSTAQRPDPPVDLEVAAATPTAVAPVANVDSKTTAAAGQQAIYSTEDLVSRTQQSVAAVITSQGTGSGFMVARNVLATNYHVIADSPSNEIGVFFPDGEESMQGPFQARIVAEQPDRDLALLRVEAEIPALEVYPNYQFRRGQDVIIIGTPGYLRQGLLPNAVTRGVLSSQARLHGLDHFQLSLAVNSGNSGGPVLGMDGRVIGVVVSKSLTEDSISFCIPATDLESLIRSEEIANFTPTAKVAALHDARLVVRTVVDQILMREIFMTKYISQVGAPLSAASASRVMQEMKRLPSSDTSDLFKSYERDLSTVARDPQLAPDVRQAISGIQRRHIAIDRLLRSPSGNFERFVNQLDSLNNDFFTYLAEVNHVLEIGRPELIQQ
jgi:S1-C subfamily serine protease